MAKKTQPGKTVPIKTVLIVTGVLLVLVFFVGQGVLKDLLFYPPAPSANYPTPANQTEAWIQDLDYLELYVRGYDRSFSFRARGRGLQLIKETQARAGDLSLAEFELAVSRIVALGENGHSNAWSGSRSRRHPAMPYHGYWFDDGYFIVGAKGEFSSLLGAQLTHIGTTPVEEIYTLFRPYYGGEDTGFKAYALPFLMENAAFLQTLGIVENPELVEVSLVLPNGEATTVSLKTLPANPDRPLFWARGWLLPEGSLPGAGDWTALSDSGAGQPLYLQQGDQPFHLKPLPEVNGLYVQYRQNNDGDGFSISTFNSQIRAAIRDLSPDVLVIDARHNGGGDYTMTAKLMFDLPGLLPEGARIYAITGHDTFSAGISSLGFLKEAAGGQLTIVGRRIGDSPLSWGETNDFVLPNSGIGMTAARGLHDQLNGCYDWIQCYWTDFDYPTAVGSLDPDIPVPFTFADYIAKRDAALEKILEIEGVK